MSDLTFNVDVLHDTNLVAKVFEYARSLRDGMKSLFFGPDNTTSEPDTLSFEVTDPKQNGNFRGVTRPKIVRTRTAVVDGVDETTQLVQPLIGKLEFSIPVGTLPADILLLRQEIVAILNDDTVMDKLMKRNIAPTA